MVICAFENPPSIPSFLATQIVYIGYGQFKTNYPFSFYLSKVVRLVFLYFIAANNSVVYYSHLIFATHSKTSIASSDNCYIFVITFVHSNHTFFCPP
jgi:hypothetical protein